MKKLLFTGCIIFLSIYSKAQLDTIPNASFENWLYLPNNTIQAVGWHANNSSIAAWNVTPDSISVTGALSLKIDKVSYRGIIWSGFPMAHHPLSLDGYMKNFLSLGDTAIISIQVYSSNVLVDSGYAEIYGGVATVFLPFTVSITQNASVADSCVITLTGGNMSGSISWFDDLSFSFPASIGEQDADTWIIFPNPCSDALHIAGAGWTGKTLIVTLSDVTGKIVSEKKLTLPQVSILELPEYRNSFVVSTQSLSKGVYLLGITDGEKRTHHFIIKN